MKNRNEDRRLNTKNQSFFEVFVVSLLQQAAIVSF